MAIFTGIECDKCGKTLAWVGTVAKRYVVAWARQKGWSVGKQILCSHCRK